MSDYLSNLAARTLGLANNVRPRLPSRFEPPAALAGPPSGLYSYDPRESEAERDLDTFDAETPPHQTRSPSAQDSTVWEPHPALDSGAARRREGGYSFAPRERHDGQQANRTSARSGHEETREESAPSDSVKDDSRGRRAHAAQGGKAVRVGFISSIETAPATDTAEGGDAAGESPRQHDERIFTSRAALIGAGRQSDAAAGHALSAPAEFLPASSPSGVQAAPRNVRLRDDAAPQASDERAETSRAAPHIRVTIGRVEVRAVMPAPPPARASRKATAPPSLDDYLKKGERGAR